VDRFLFFTLILSLTVALVLLWPPFSSLVSLNYSELPLHNNPAELAARTMVQRRNISYRTQTIEGTQAWDTFMSLVATTGQLEISFFEYVRDRISQLGNIPCVGTIILEKSSLLPLGLSW